MSDQTVMSFVVIGSFFLVAVVLYFLIRDRKDAYKSIPPEVFQVMLELLQKFADQTATPIDNELLAVIRKEIADANTTVVTSQDNTVTVEPKA